MEIRRSVSNFRAFVAAETSRRRPAARCSAGTHHGDGPARARKALLQWDSLGLPDTGLAKAYYDVKEEKGGRESRVVGDGNPK